VSTDQVYGSPKAAPNPNQEEFATETDTTGTSAAGIGAALPGGSLQDTAPTYGGYGTAGPETGKPGSEYAVTETAPGTYGALLGSPDTEGAYGGGTPAAYSPVNTALTGTLDTTVGGGDYFYSSLGTPPAYRAPSSYVAGGSKDTTLTDILGNQIAAQPLTDASYAAVNVDTSYIGAPAAPAPLSSQVDTYASSAVSTPYYASQLGVMPSTLVVKDVTKGTTLAATTNYTVTTAGNGAGTALYITLLTSSGYTAGDTISLNYSYGTPQYFDSNLPAPQSLTVTDMLYLSSTGMQLSQWGVTTAAGSITVYDVTRGASLAYNTDYTVKQVSQPYTPNESWLSPSQVPVSYVITRNVNSGNCSNGDIIQATYAYSTSVPSAPGMGSVTTQTDTVSGFASTPSALSKTGIITTPGQLVVTDQTSPRAGNVLVLNKDYTLTVSGSGSSLTYSIARLSGSTLSSSGDSVTVAYSYGNSAYFTSGPVLPQNRGVYVPWTPPSGTVEVDFYFIRCSDGGTMYVPATGEPALYGQPSPSGGADSGNPVYQTDTFTSGFGSGLALSKTGILTAPGQLTVRDLTSSERDPLQPTGTVLEYGYDYTVTSTGMGPWLTYTVTRVATSVNSAAGDTITVDYWYDTMGTVPLAATSDSVTLVAGSATLHQSQIVTAAFSLIVYDSTISKPLAYGLDYTVAATGDNPGLGYTLTAVTSGPAGAGATDTLHVYYLYGTVLSALFTQGMTENIGPIYNPSGTVRSFQGYQFSVAAGNRAGLGPFSAWSDYTAPLNPNVSSAPTFHGYPGTLDPANTINPIYLPNGTVKAGTGLGA
jgi:hypothetical protein